MIVSERATGRHTRPTLLLAGLLAAVSIPAWSFNQTQAKEVAKVQAANAKRAAAADQAKRAAIEQELLAHMAMLDEKQAILQEQARGDASPEAIAELQAARDMVRAKLEALQADHAALTDDLRKHVEANVAAFEARKVDLHRTLADLELKRAELLEKTAGDPDPADVAALDEARVLLIEKIHAELGALDADAKAKLKARRTKQAPPDAETVKRQAVKELLDAMLNPGSEKAQHPAEEAADADALKTQMRNARAYQELLHRYYKGLGRQTEVEAADTDDAAALHTELMRRYFLQLDKQKQATAAGADEARATDDLDLLKRRHMEVFQAYKKAIADEAAAAGQPLTDADRAKLESHARALQALKAELARKVQAKDAESVGPKN